MSKNKLLVDWELIIPSLFIVAGTLLALSLPKIEKDQPYLFAGLLVLSAALFGFALLSFYAMNRLWELRQQRWLEEQAKEERTMLREGKSYSSTDHLQQIKEKYKIFESLLPQNKEELKPAHDALKEAMNKEMLPLLTGLSSKEKEKFKTFHGQFEVLKSLKPSDDSSAEYKAHYQAIETNLNSAFNTYALSWLKEKV